MANPLAIYQNLADRGPEINSLRNRAEDIKQKHKDAFSAIVAGIKSKLVESLDYLDLVLSQNREDLKKPENRDQVLEQANLAYKSFVEARLDRIFMSENLDDNQTYTQEGFDTLKRISILLEELNTIIQESMDINDLGLEAFTLIDTKFLTSLPDERTKAETTHLSILAYAMSKLGV